MKVFLSSIENSSNKELIEYLLNNNIQADYILISYFYFRKSGYSLDVIKNISKEILVDSGAHSFQKGSKVEWETYTKEYAEWINKNDCKQILGYFEMDIDNIVGLDNVLYLRNILEKVSNKIIPVWHKNRGIEEYKNMCKKYKFAAVTGFKNEDIKDSQYLMFLNYARKHNCKIHCLGMTRTNILNTVPFYSTDSSSWKQSAVYGRFTKFFSGKFKLIHQPKNISVNTISKQNFIEYMKAQRYFYNKWKNFKKQFAIILLKTKEIY